MAKAKTAKAKSEKYTQLRWGHWHPDWGVRFAIFSNRASARADLPNGWRVVRVKIEVV